MPVKVAAAVAGGMVKELRHVLEPFPELGGHCVVDAEEDRLGPQAFRDQPQGHGCRHVHEPGIVHFRIGTGVVEGVQRLFRDAGQEMLVEEAHGAYRFHRQYGQHQQEQRLSSRGRECLKISKKVLMESTNQAVFVV